MRCAESERAILLDEAGELPEKKKQALTQHLADCERCREYLDDLGQIAKWTEATAARQDPRPAVIARIRAAADRKAAGRIVIFPVPLARGLAYAAAIALLIGAWLLVPVNGRTERISEISTILAMVSTEDKLPDSEASRDSGSDEALRSLATQLLQMEGLADDDLTESEHEGLAPTALRWRSTGETPARRYV